MRLLLILLFFFSSSQSSAETLIKTNEDIFLESFYGHCYSNINNLEKLESAAKVFRWKKLDEEMWNLVGPEKSNAESKGWMFLDNNLMMFIGINKGEFRGKMSNICSLTTKKIDSDVIMKKLVKNFKLEKILEEKDAYQLVTAYKINTKGNSAIITATTLINMPRDMITLAIVK